MAWRDELHASKSGRLFLSPALLYDRITRARFGTAVTMSRRHLPPQFFYPTQRCSSSLKRDPAQLWKKSITCAESPTTTLRCIHGSNINTGDSDLMEMWKVDLSVLPWRNQSITKFRAKHDYVLLNRSAGDFFI